MKKVLKIITLIMLIITIWKISDTYAKYYNEITTPTLTEEIGKWEIKVNEMDIYSATGESVEFEIDPFDSFSNPHAAQNTISPSSTGMQYFVIDPTGTDVAVRYDFVLDLTGVSDIVSISAKLEKDSGAGTLVKTGPNTYSGILTLSEVQAGDKAEISCYVTWHNDETKNDIDTAGGSTYGTIMGFNASVTVSQYLGELIEPYVEPGGE